MTVKIINRINTINYENWSKYYIQYLTFNKNQIKERNLQKLWKWLNNPHHPQKGIFAIIEKNIIGHAHYRGSPNTVRGNDIGFLDDIYINQKYRNTGVAYKIMKKLCIEGKKNKWELIRWNCSSENTNAINFYKKFAKKLEWHTFEIKI